MTAADIAVVVANTNQRLSKLYETAHQFVDEVAHEFRTPLTVIKEFASIMDEGLIGELNQRHALVVVEHDMQFIRRIARTVTVFHQGAVLIEGDVARIMSDARVRDVYLGKQAA